MIRVTNLVTIFTIVFISCIATSVLSSEATAAEENLKTQNPWINLLKPEIFQRILSTKFFTEDHRLEFPDPVEFGNQTFNLDWMFRDGELNVYNARIVGLSKVVTSQFTINLSTNRVEIELTVAQISLKGLYDIWIDYYSIISPHPYERHRGQGNYLHLFNNVKFNLGFNLEYHSVSGRLLITNPTVLFNYESCNLYSENYSINSRPITDWNAVSIQWKTNWDVDWAERSFIVEDLAAVLINLSYVFSQATREQVIENLVQNGAVIIG